jgi:tetratricopeptide (TPR) repeat protein
VTTTAVDILRERAAHALSRLRGVASADDLADARELTVDLCRARLFALLAELAEAIARREPRDVRTRRLYAQALIEQGHATVAIDVLKQLIGRLPLADPEHAEAAGLLGRAWKQIFFDAGDKTATGARDALKQAIACYRKPFEHADANTWHAVNLVALLTRARRLGLRVASDVEPVDLARGLVARLQTVPDASRDRWYLPTLAEALLATGDWDGVAKALRGYVADERSDAFLVASTLRQFTQVWDLESVDARGRALVDILRARLLQLEGGELRLSAAELMRAQRAPDPPAAQLEAVLGGVGPNTWRWWKAGLERARSICSVRTRIGDRIGTGWLVRAGSLGRVPPDELLVVTNFHVVNPEGSHDAITPDDAELVFEAVGEASRYGVARIVWSSPPDRLDCSLLRLSAPAEALTPLPLARALPPRDRPSHVYVIGHPGGRELAFSLQDNALLDHEGPPAGKPAIDGVCRVHYRAPTEGGSSGSPVFDAARWEVIALHHSGGKLGVPRLNGEPGTYAANEGLSIQSIVAASTASA